MEADDERRVTPDMDGANVEIYEQVGADNIYIFGMRADTVANLYKEGNYTPVTVFENNAEFAAMTQIIDGTLFPTIRRAAGFVP